MRNKRLVLGGIAVLVVVVIVILAIAVFGGSGKTTTTLTPAENGTYTLLSKGSSAILQGGGNCTAKLEYRGTTKDGWAKMKGDYPSAYGPNFRFNDGGWALYCERGTFARLSKVESEGKQTMVKVELLPIKLAPAQAACTPASEPTPAPTATPEPIVTLGEGRNSTSLVAGQTAEIPACGGEVQFVRTLPQGDINIFRDGDDPLWGSYSAGYGHTLVCGEGAISYTLREDGKLDVAYATTGPLMEALATPESSHTVTETASTPEPSPIYTADCDGQIRAGTVRWTNADNDGRTYFEVDSPTVGTISFSMPSADGDVIKGYLANKTPDYVYSFFVTGCEPYEVVDLWDKHMMWTKQDGITDFAQAWSKPLPEYPVNLQVAVAPGTRFFDMEKLWAQVDAPTNTMWWVELGVVSHTEFFSGEPCADPLAVQAGIVDLGELKNYVCLSPGQWARVELRKVEYDGTGPVAVVVGSFYWAPGNPVGQRSTNIAPPATPVATFVFDADQLNYDIK